MDLFKFCLFIILCNILHIYKIKQTFLRIKILINKTLPQKISTNEEGIFYKRIINEKGKEIDKTFLVGLLLKK